MTILAINAIMTVYTIKTIITIVTINARIISAAAIKQLINPSETKRFNDVSCIIPTYNIHNILLYF